MPIYSSHANKSLSFGQKNVGYQYHPCLTHCNIHHEDLPHTGMCVRYHTVISLFDQNVQVIQSCWIWAYITHFPFSLIQNQQQINFPGRSWFTFYWKCLKILPVIYTFPEWDRHFDGVSGKNRTSNMLQMWVFHCSGMNSGRLRYRECWQDVTGGHSLPLFITSHVMEREVPLVSK